MKFSSQVEQDVKSNDDFMVFCYQEVRVVLPLPATFAVRAITLNRVRIADTVAFRMLNGSCAMSSRLML